MKEWSCRRNRLLSGVGCLLVGMEGCLGVGIQEWVRPPSAFQHISITKVLVGSWGAEVMGGCFGGIGLPMFAYQSWDLLGMLLYVALVLLRTGAGDCWGGQYAQGTSLKRSYVGMLSGCAGVVERFACSLNAWRLLRSG